MPFEYIGRYEDTTGLIVFLSKGDNIYTVSQGDVIDDTYLVGPIDGESMELTYLPLKEKQIIKTGGA